MWKPPAITDFIKKSELFWFGVLIIFLVIITYPGDKNKSLLIKSDTEREFLKRTEYLERKAEDSKNLEQSGDIITKRALYQDAINRQDYNLAMKIARDMIFIDSENQLHWLQEFHKLSHMFNSYQELLNIYLKVFKITKKPEIKKFIFIEIIKIYQAKEDYVAIKDFLAKYHKDFLKDTDMAYFILKTALATGDAKFSNKIASSIKEEHTK